MSAHPFISYNSVHSTQHHGIYNLAESANSETASFTGYQDIWILQHGLQLAGSPDAYAVVLVSY